MAFTLSPFACLARATAEHVLIDDGRPSTGTSLRLGCVESSAGSLLDEAALKLRHGSDHLKHETAVGRTGVDVGQRTREHLEPNAALSKGVDHGHEVDEGPGEAVELPHAQGVAGPGVVQCGRELWPVGVLPAGLVLEDAGAACDRQCVVLKLRFLVVGGYAGVNR
jgi:hypothetical protein